MRYITGSIALLAILPSVAFAQDTTKTRRDSTQKLGQITVTAATRTERTITDVPLSTSVERGDEVRATPALTIDDALRATPSLNMPLESAITAHPTSDNLSMRGLGGQRTLVLLDGVPLTEPMSGYIEWQKVPMELVDHVEVVRGGSSSLYGTYAVGGVVNIITARPTTDELVPSVSYGSNGTVRSNVLASTALSPTVRLTVNGNWFTTDGYVRPVPSEAGPIDLASWSRVGTGFADLSVKLDHGASAYFRTNYYNLFQNQGSPLAVDGQESLDFAGGLDRLPAWGGKLTATLYYRHDREWTANTDPITTRGVDEFLSNFHETPVGETGASAVWTGLSADSKWVTTLGADARIDMGEDRADNYSAPHVFAYHEVGGGTQRNVGAFAQADFFPTSHFELIGSVRLDAWQNINGHDDRSDKGNTLYPDRSASSFNPKLAARYRLSDSWSLRAAAYRAFNAPNLDELYRPYTAESYGNVQNPALGPETLVGGEVGAEYAAGPATIQMNVFENDVTDVITYNAISFSPVYTTQPQNIGSQRARGVELFGNWDFASGWRFSASYTYTQSVVTSNPPDTTIVGKTQGDTPRNYAAASIGHFGSGWTFYVQGRYVGSRFSDVTDTQPISDFFVTDVSGSVFLNRSWEAFAQVENLFNRLYVVQEYGYNGRGAPLQIFAGIRAHLGHNER